MTFYFSIAEEIRDFKEAIPQYPLLANARFYLQTEIGKGLCEDDREADLRAFAIELGYQWPGGQAYLEEHKARYHIAWDR